MRLHRHIPPAFHSGRQGYPCTLGGNVLDSPLLACRFGSIKIMNTSGGDTAGHDDVHSDPSPATSLAKVFDQPTRPARKPLDTARFGMGVMTPEEVLVTTRPQPRALIEGKTALVIAMTLTTIF